MAAVSEEQPKKGFLGKFADSFPSINDLFSSDSKKEIGFLAIVAWHHGITRLAAKQKVSIPPVLLSTLGMLLGLSIIRQTNGKGTTDQIVEYFDPSVDFLGKWMSLWLVPSLVLLPNALRKIEKTEKSMWVKLIIIHFILWCGSTVGSAKLYESIERYTRKAAPIAIAESASGQDGSQNGTAHGADSVPSTTGETESELVKVPSSSDVDVSINADISPACSPSNDVSPSICPVNDSTAAASPSTATTENEIKAEKFRKQLQLLRFWGAITVGFYAAPLNGLIASTVPALGGTTITALIGGQMMPEKVKKILHPLLFATFISAIAAVLSDRLILGNPALSTFEKAFSGKNKSWIDSLCTYTSLTTPAVITAVGASSSIPLPSGVEMCAGDYFAMVLGPACTALAFRIFSQSEKLHSKLPAILAASSIAAVTSLIVSPLLGAVVGVPAELNNALAHRSISSALAVPSASMTGASSELTVAAVLLTGLYGASGQWILDRHNITDEISAGVAYGTAAHSIGTASLLPARPDAAAVASVSLVSAGIAHAVVCSIPGVPFLINKLATLNLRG